ncbi:unnamed protein product [marine sediment metagenome]|uniref:Uncharacterized protein n=1 Tax=marine sediment metagenome TaxID=412755 RepID=X0SEW7_9ZZZZ
MIYTGYKITIDSEERPYRTWQGHNDYTHHVEAISIYLVKGPGIRNRKFYKLKDAKQAIRKQKRKGTETYETAKDEVAELKMLKKKLNKELTYVSKVLIKTENYLKGV